jgi:hypothetical protein
MTKIPILMRILNLVYEHVCSRKKIKLLWNLLKHIRIEKSDGMPLCVKMHIGSTNTNDDRTANHRAISSVDCDCIG